MSCRGWAVWEALVHEVIWTLSQKTQEPLKGSAEVWAWPRLLPEELVSMGGCREPGGKMASALERQRQRHLQTQSTSHWFLVTPLLTHISSACHPEAETHKPHPNRKAYPKSKVVRLKHPGSGQGMKTPCVLKESCASYTAACLPYTSVHWKLGPWGGGGTGGDESCKGCGLMQDN